MPVEDLPVLKPESEGPFWISPDRLGALRPSNDTITWQDLQWLVSARTNYRDGLPFLNLLPEQALFLAQPAREIVTLDTVGKIPGPLGSDISIGTAYFDVDTGLLLSRTDTLTAPGAKYVRTMLTLSEINPAFTALVFDRYGYLTDMTISVPAMAIAVDSRSGLNRTIRIDGLDFYQGAMHGPASPSGQPLITPRCQLTIPPEASARLARDGFRLLLAGEAGRDYVTEYSDDLVHWWPLATNQVANANLAVEIVDPQATHLMKRFYRGRPWR